jgi:2-oxoglutarate dehydrogenase E2 component (dihydrolipoamide succinyltransferase)
MPGEIRVPVLGESVVEAVVGRWLKEVGDTIAVGDSLVELETEKINLEVPAEESGVLTARMKASGETVTVGTVLGTLAVSSGDGVPAPPAPEGEAPPVDAAEPDRHETEVAATQLPSASGDAPGSPPVATPLARRLASASSLDLGAVQGSGVHGRIVRQDVRAAVEGGRISAPALKPDAAASLAPAPEAGSRGARERRVRMSRRRQTIARRLLEAQHSAAMLTTFNEVDMTAVMDTRTRHKETFKEHHGVGLGFMSFFTKAVVGALKAFPRLNAEIQGDEIVLKAYYDIGIAVGVDEGLVVPVLRDADQKSFAQIERGIADLATRARGNGLTLSDLAGGTFTITNGGVYGSLLSTPILNTPQVGILGMHKIEQRPMAIGGQVVIRPMMYVALSYDHRIVDGGEAVRFLVKVKELLEDPMALLLEA